MISAWQKVEVDGLLRPPLVWVPNKTQRWKAKGGKMGGEALKYSHVCVSGLFFDSHSQTLISKATHVIRSKAFLRVHRQNKWQTPAPYHLISSWLRDFRQNSGSFLSIRISLISFAALCCFSLWTTETCLWPSLFPCPSWLWSIFSPTWPTTLSSQFLQS